MKAPASRSLRIPLVLALLLAGWTAGGAAPSLPPGKSGGAGFPVLNLGGRSQGEAAIRALGEDLPAVAHAYGKSAEELRSLLRNDATLHLDNEGRLLFADEPLPAPEGAGIAAVVPPASAPLSETFKLHSRPGSKRTIYLDFDGHLITGSGWNSYNGGADIQAPPFDRDGVPGVFNDSERTLIQQVWRRVVEDYAPFDVDVTTELADESVLTRSGSADDVFGMRVLVSPISSYFGNYGGIAYVGVFDFVGDTYKPALVFPEGLAWNEKYIAEACSHESGHTLGLSHDGTTSGTTYYAGHGSGTTGWAPIMGNSYYKNVTQWSRGEYADANNREDDLAIITQRGLPRVADEFGGTLDSAAYFPAGTALSTAGILGVGADVDVLAFSAGSGPATVSIQPMPLGPNLDLSVDLLDAVGGVVASSAAVDQLGAGFSLNLAAGTYFLRVRGVGFGSSGATGYTDYASAGYYTVTGTVTDPSGTVPPVAVVRASEAAPLVGATVSFDGAGSFDPDGAVVGYQWDFGDGTTASGAAVSHAYASAGTYTVSLVVTDDDGLTDGEAIQIAVQTPNQSPVAVLAASPSSGTAPLPVSFDGSGSVDPDGSLVSYLWNFGDGTPNGSGSQVQHIYQAAGQYTATLTVTDDRGATAVQSTVIAVSAPPATILRVQDIVLALNKTKAGTACVATVLVTTPQGVPVAGAKVTGAWSGVVSGSASGTTGADGRAVLTSKRVKKSGVFSFKVTGLAKSGCIYDPSANLVVSVSISGAETD